MKTRLLIGLGLLSLAFGCQSPKTNATPEEVRAIAKEAFIYGFPLVDNMRVQYSYFVDEGHPNYKGPYNTLVNIPRVFTPDDRAIQTPNSDTPYSWIGLDLRTEPMVFTVPPIASERYWSLQLIDLYTHNFDIPGSRADGNNGGTFLVAGPNWQGEKPEGITRVIRCETEIASAQFRTQLFNPADLPNVQRIQQQYIAQPLSAFLRRSAPAAAPTIDFPQPLTPVTQRSSLEFFSLLNFYLQFCPTHPSEVTLMERFARIGVGAGKTFDPTKLSPEMKEAFQAGVADAWAEFEVLKGQFDRGEVTSGDAFGTREHLNNNYLFRMGAAVIGIYGLSKEEAIYLPYFTDADGERLDGTYRYTMRFPKGQLPPVNAFWSLTMYDLPASLLIHNPIDRYLLNSTMLSQFKRDPDGGVTLYIQHESPGQDREANWLPAPQGAFWLVNRLYWPKPEALDGTWQQAPLVRVPPATDLTAQAVEDLVADAYVHCFPMVENYKGVYFYGVWEASPFFTPMNTVKHETRLYTADDKAVVRANNDTFYSTGCLDLRAEPVIFKVPESEGRYYVLQLVSMTTDNFGYIGTRATGSQAGIYAVTSPHFTGALPDGVVQIKAPSEFVAVAGRTGVNSEDPSDMEAAKALQSRIEIGVMSQFYPEFAPKAVEKLNFPVYSQATITTPEFFSVLNFLLPHMVLSNADAAMMKRFAVIGVHSGGSFTFLKENPEYEEAFAAGVKKGLARIDAMMTEIGTIVNGWMLWPIQDPYFGQNFRLRTQIARGHIYANCPIEAYYPAARRDAEGNPLNGRNTYTLTFPADALPPVKFFWSLTMYDNETGLMSHNELNRYSIGDRTRGLKYNSDGSLTLYMGYEMPEEGPHNWLPAPNGPFDILLRLYGPKDQVMNKAWVPQPVVKLGD